MFSSRVLSALTALIMFPSAAGALVLCAKRGEAQDSVIVGSAVVVRVACAENETTLLPFSVQPGGNVTETVPASKNTSIGINSVVTIGQNAETAIGGSSALVVGADKDEAVGRSATLSVGQDYLMNIGESAVINVGGGRVEVIGTNSGLKVGTVLIVDAAQQIVLRSGKSSISMKKNGDINISVGKITIKGSGSVNVNGTKLRRN